jgi:hypothetical protein
MMNREGCEGSSQCLLKVLFNFVTEINHINVKKVLGHLASNETLILLFQILRPHNTRNFRMVCKRNHFVLVQAPVQLICS